MNKNLIRVISFFFAALMLSSCDDIKDKVVHSQQVERTIKTIAAVDSLKKYYTAVAADFRAKAQRAEQEANTLQHKYRELKAQYQERVNRANDTWIMGDLAQLTDALQEAKTGVNPYDQMESEMNRLENDANDKENDRDTYYGYADDCEKTLTDLSKVSTYSDLMDLGKIQNGDYHVDFMSVYKSLPKLKISNVDVLEKLDNGEYKLTITSNYKAVSLTYNKKTDAVIKINQ